MIDAVRTTADYLTGAAILMAGIGVAGLPLASSEGSIPGSVLFIGLGVAVFGLGLSYIADTAEEESEDVDAPAEEEPVAYGQA